MPGSKKKPVQKPGSVDVSVVVCTLNEEKRVKACLEHLRKQEFGGTFEIIVADGYSDDKTVELARPLVDKIVLEKVRRISAERQAGGMAARGKIIAFTDADSHAPKEWVQRIWDLFERNPSAAMVYGPVFLHDVAQSEQRLGKIVMPVFMRLFHRVGLASPIGSNIAIRSSVFKKIRGFDTHFVTCEDLDLAKRARKHGQLLFDSRLQMLVSGRRVKKWGYLRFSLFHLWNGIQYHLFKKARTDYEDVR